MRRLCDAYTRFHAETEHILDLFRSPVPTSGPFALSCPPAHERCREMCVVRLYDAWTRFCRELIVCSAADEPLCLGGLRLGKVAGVTRRSDVVPIVKRRMGTNWEPRWGMPGKCINAARTLGLDNFSTISTALGATPSPAEHIRCTRNFLAHRAFDAQRLYAATAVQMGHLPTTTVDQLITHRIPAAGTRFEVWIGELRMIAQACIQ